MGIFAHGATLLERSRWHYAKGGWEDAPERDAAAPAEGGSCWCGPLRLVAGVSRLVSGWGRNRDYAPGPRSRIAPLHPKSTTAVLIKPLNVTNLTQPSGSQSRRGGSPTAGLRTAIIAFLLCAVLSSRAVASPHAVRKVQKAFF